MKRLLLICALVLLCVPCLAQAQVSPYMSYQGVLRDGSGNPVPDGSYYVTFRIYNVDAGGTALWTESQTLAAEGGIINAYLGSVVPFPLAFDVPYWLGISVEGEAELVPRTLFTTVPYAVHAVYAETCLEGDEDWQFNGGDIYRDVGNVGIGTVAPAVRLDVQSGDQPCVRFENASGTSGYTVQAVNLVGTAGAFYAGVPASVHPDVPSALLGVVGDGYRGAQFQSSTDDAIYTAAFGTGAGIYANSTDGYAGYFGGGGLGIYVEDQLETEAFKMPAGATSGHVLTSDGDGLGTWQPASAGGDSDWTISGSDMYSGVTGSVGIGESSPTAKLEVYTTTGEEALEVKHGGPAFTVVNIERTSMPSVSHDLLELRIPAGSPDGCQFIEAERVGEVNFAVDADGSIWGAGKLEVIGTEEKQAEISTSSVTYGTHAVSGVITGTGSSDAVGVYGESVPSDYWGYGGQFVGGYCGVLGMVNSTGSQDYHAVYGQAGGGTGNNYGVYGVASTGTNNYGVYGSAWGGTTYYAGYFSGNAHVSGTFTAGVKSFKIDHPLDPEGKYLVHSCVESDDMMNIYNGNATLDARGEAWVEMPQWFEALNQDFRYQLTPIGSPGPNLYVAEEIRGNRFMIAGGEPGMKVSWLVTGVRHDPLAEASRVVVEQDKPANEVGKYMHPEAYGMPVTAGVDYHEARKIPNGVSSNEVTTRAVRDGNDGE